MKTHSQLLGLTIKNFRSFYTEQHIDFSDTGKGRTVTAFYGPNASGKSNIALALRFVQDFVRNSNSANMTQIPSQPFLLKTSSKDEPMTLEVEYTQDSRHFVYGFSLLPSVVKHEYLLEYASKTKKARTIFDRTQKGLNTSAERYGFGKRLYETTRPTSLLMTKARENNNEYANLLFEWFDSLNILLGKENETMSWSLSRMQEDPSLYQPAMELLKGADLWLEGFDIETVGIPLETVNQMPLPDEVKQQFALGKATTMRVNTVHAVRDKNQKIVGRTNLDLGGHESSGTQKFFELAAPIIDTLREGKILYLDEFGTYLHPDICQFIVALFNSSRNKYNAQVILNTHDTSLLAKGAQLKRKNVFFVEKDHTEESIVISLADRSDRSEELFEKRYREGHYGARPFIEARD